VLIASSSGGSDPGRARRAALARASRLPLTGSLVTTIVSTRPTSSSRQREKVTSRNGIKEGKPAPRSTTPPLAGLQCQLGLSTRGADRPLCARLARLLTLPQGRPGHLRQAAAVPLRPSRRLEKAPRGAPCRPSYALLGVPRGSRTHETHGPGVDPRTANITQLPAREATRMPDALAACRRMWGTKISRRRRTSRADRLAPS
jgi:hypothetical protein